MPRRGLSEAALAAAAQDLGVDVAALQAVAEIESAGSGFDEEGRPQILFERHYFHRLTRGRYDKAHPDISHPTRGGYGRLRAQYSRLERAYRLHARASLQSASWGRFQIMGAHYAKLGFDSPQEMVQAMARSEEEHLRAFVALLKTMPAARAGLVSHDWAKFARAYNGKDFAENRYDTKLKAAYERHQSRVAAHGSGASPSPLMLSPRG
jgi:hypothetical protein